ncbi:hypothetical protein GCM10027426_01230 [Microbacterium lacusdiani]
MPLVDDLTDGAGLDELERERAGQVRQVRRAAAENTTLGRFCQMRAKSGPLSPNVKPFSQGSMSWYSRRPHRWASSSAVCAVRNVISSSSGVVQSMDPSGAAMYPSSETPNS